MVPKTWRWSAISRSIWSATSPTSDQASAAASAPPGTRNTCWTLSARCGQSRVTVRGLTILQGAGRAPIGRRHNQLVAEMLQTLAGNTCICSMLGIMGGVVMSRIVLAAGVAIAWTVAGCSIHPVPEEVTGIDTLDIVKQIRCEARDTLRTLIIIWLQGRASKTNDPLFLNLAAQYQSNPASINSFHYNLFKGPRYAEERSDVKLFYDAGIAYNFDLMGTETNNIDPQSSFIRTFFDHKFTLGLTAASDRIRSNDRVFTATDTFGKLLTSLREDYCDGHIVIANYQCCPVQRG
jgi:hypothetical protein